MPVHATENNGTSDENEVVTVIEEPVEESREELIAESQEEAVEESIGELIEEATEESSVEQEEVAEESIPETEIQQEQEENPPVTESVPETESVIPEERDTETVEEVLIPEVLGLPEADARAMLQSIILPDGTVTETIVEYRYSKEAQKDIVFEQSVSGMVPIEDARKVCIVISMGVDPDETIVDGITEPLNQKITSRYGINWEEQPEVYEYNWDNSEECWEKGIWIDNVKYITPKGTYNTNVRHKIQLYTDGTYVYTHIVFSRDYEAAANGNWYKYYVDGNLAAFQIETYNGTQLANNNLSPGTYEVVVRHADGSVSGQVATGASAFYTVFESQVNAHLEMRIPLSEMVLQNENIDADSFGSITFTTPNLMLGTITAAGAGTSPFAMAVAAFAIIPAVAVIKSKKRKEDTNVQ